MDKRRILITPKEACDSISFMPRTLLGNFEIMATGGRVADEKDLIGLLKDKDGVVLDIEKITCNVLKQCPSVKVISRFGEGCDSIDTESAKRYGVCVTRTTGVASRAVARHAMALIMAVTHRIAENDKALKQGRWARMPNIPEESTVLGILGLGKIGSALAELAGYFGFQVVAYDTARKCASYRSAADMDELIAKCDILSLHLPLTEQTRGIISRDVIRRLSDKYLVNTSRGALVDEGCLLEALNKGEIAGYATDVFVHEPLFAMSKELARHPKVICSPHVACFDRSTAVHMTQRSLENIFYSLNNGHDKVNSYVVR